MAISNKNALRTLLMDVLFEGAVIIDHKKLLGYMGKSHDRPTVWEQLLEEWVELEQPSDTLCGLGVGTKIILTLPPYEKGNHVKIEAWAGRKSDN